MEKIKTWATQWYTENWAFYKSSSWATVVVNILILLLLLVF